MRGGSLRATESRKMVYEHNEFLARRTEKKIKRKIIQRSQKKIINSHFKRYIKTFFVFVGCWASTAGQGSALVAVDIFIIHTRVLEICVCVCVFCWR